MAELMKFSKDYFTPFFQNSSLSQIDGDTFAVEFAHGAQDYNAKKFVVIFTDEFVWFINNGDVITEILSEGEEYFDQGTASLLRVSTIYWKSQKKIGHLTKIAENGEVVNELVSEDYVIEYKPIYDNRLFKNKTKDRTPFPSGPFF